jgi:predicted nucleic acid-binding protein
LTAASRLAIVDTGPLLAAAHTGDPYHERSVRFFRSSKIRLVLPALVVAETLFFIGDRLGPIAEARYLGTLHATDIRSPHPDDWARIAELVHQYRDFPLGSVDASVIALAERLNADTIITFDRRHFSVVRPRHVSAFRLMPE